jgi:transposase
MEITFTPTNKSIKFDPIAKVVSDFKRSGLSYRQYAELTNIPKSTLFDMVKASAKPANKKTKKAATKPTKVSKRSKEDEIQNLIDDLYWTFEAYEDEIAAKAAEQVDKLYSITDQLAALLNKDNG